jgi:hypothetical protein
MHIRGSFTVEGNGRIFHDNYLLVDLVQLSPFFIFQKMLVSLAVDCLSNIRRATWFVVSSIVHRASGVKEKQE